MAGLIAKDKKTLIRNSILEFIVSGLRYVFPAQPGALQKGMPTAHSAFPLNKEIQSNNHYVWPHIKGTVRGQAIKPLHPKIPDACINDQTFYEFMALCEAIRVGKARERDLAKKAIKALLS
jgi:hypothetical protein